jgi:hypothetical protein
VGLLGLADLLVERGDLLLGRLDLGGELVGVLGGGLRLVVLVGLLLRVGHQRGHLGVEVVLGGFDRGGDDGELRVGGAVTLGGRVDHGLGRGELGLEALEALGGLTAFGFEIGEVVFDLGG